MSAAVDEPVNPTVAAAMAFRARGWHVFPIDHPSLPKCASKHVSTGGKCPEPDKRGKHNVGHWPTIAASTMSDKTLYWNFNDQGARNIGIACKPSDLMVIDEDELGALEALAERLGETVPLTYRVRTGRGWHYYFRPLPGEIFGNYSGALKPLHIDVRGNGGGAKDEGGYVVAAGSTHMSGAVYTAEDPDAEPVERPQWLADQIFGATGGVDEEGNPMPGVPSSWTDQPRDGYRAELVAQYERHRAEVRTPGFRRSLFLAALDGWRLVNAGVKDRSEMLGEIKQTIAAVWGGEPDFLDHKIVYSEAKPKALESPWRVLDAPTLPSTGTTPSSGSGLQSVAALDYGTEPGTAVEAYDPVAAAERDYEAQLKARVQQKRLDREASRTLAAEDLPEVTVLDWDAFLSSEQPEYLVPRMLYRDSTAKVYGPPGSSKSFFLLDLALCMATGTPWRGFDLPRTRVHYVMAEGQAVNVARTLAWLHGNEVDRDAGRGWFDAIPQGVLLTPEGVARYLERVVDERPGVVILDTKNAMMDGEENSASDVAVMVRAMRAIRDVSQACVVLVDHTGMSDATRGRGSNAVTAAMDTEIRIARDEDSGQLVAEVTRDKAAEPGAQWGYRLRTVEHVPGIRPGIATPAVVDHNAAAWTASPFLSASRWYDVDQEALPEEISACTEKGAPAARDIFKVLRFVDDPDGITRAKIEAALREGPRTHGDSTVTTALALLARKGWAQKPTVGRYMLGTAYLPG